MTDGEAAERIEAAQTSIDLAFKKSMRVTIPEDGHAYSGSLIPTSSWALARSLVRESVLENVADMPTAFRSMYLCGSVIR